MIQLSLNLSYQDDVRVDVSVNVEPKKPKRIRSKNPKKKILYQIITREDGTVINDFENWRTLRGYAVELFQLCGFIPFFGSERIEQCGIRVMHDVYDKEPYTHEGNEYMGQSFDHYEAEVIGAELLPVLDRITIYKEIIDRLRSNMHIEQAVREVQPIIEELKNGKA